ncbi:unnamed protein product [Prunus armeniaca]
MNEGEVVHHVPTVSELVPFNHLPIEGENDILHPISGSGVSLRGSLAQQHLLKPANHASTSEMSCGEPKLGADVSSLQAMIDALMVTAVDNCSTHSTYSQKLSPEAQSDRLAVIDSSLSIALALQQAEEARQFSTLESIKYAESDAQLSHHHGVVTCLREDKITVEGAPILFAADAETLDALKVSFERLRNDFRDLS